MSDNFLTHKLWLGISRWHWLEIWLGFMFVIIMLAMVLVTHNAAQDEKDSDTLNYNACESRNDLVEVVRQVILDSEGSPNGIDLTGTTGFEDLDPEVQTFLYNLRDETQAAAQETIDDPDSFVNRALKKVPDPRDCDAEFPDHE